jgi:hypothetical protein
MDEMIKPRPLAFLATDFNAFLFASIGAGQSGEPVSVVSALARLDLDPWEEAERLSCLPGAAAAEQLSMLIARLADIAGSFEERQKTAKRLVGLLPNRKLGKILYRAAPKGEMTVFSPLAIASVFLIAVAILLGGQLLVHLAQPIHAPLTMTATTQPAATNIH